MILILNGSFGVGKTTVGRLLRKRLAGSRLYNPEWAGSILMRLPPVFKLEGSGTDDFQDLALWRKSVVRGTKLFRALGGETVIVPMAFSRRDYFDEILKGMREFDASVKVFCLQAGMETIVKRLRRRGEKIDDGDDNWVIRKARECIEAHRDKHFGEPVNTEEISAAEVADEILKRLDVVNQAAK
jgi:hypothetical protein